MVALLEKNAEERTFELAGGFRFSRGGAKGTGKSSSPIHDLELPTVTLALKWLTALIELLRSKTSTMMTVGGASFLSVVRVEGQIRVIRIQNNVASKEVWLQFDDVVLEVREQAKLYLAVANRIEQVLERREAQLADKQRKDAAQKRKAISNKLHTAAFTSMLDTLHALLAGCATDFPALAKRFQDQEAHLAQQRRRVKEENQDMTNMFFATIPANLLEANFKHITAKLEPEQPTAEEIAAAAAAAAEADMSSAPTGEAQQQAAPAKKLSKKEAVAAAAAAAAAEAERKKQAEADAETSRKEAEKVRREKQEKLLALQADQKRKQLSANPFTHLEGFSENSVAALEAEQEQAKEHQIKRAAEAKTKQQEREAAEAKRAAHDAEVSTKARTAKITAAAQDTMKKQATEDSKKSAQREAEEKRKTAQREIEDKKKAAAERAAAEKAAADKKKQEKADRVAAEKSTADKKKAEKAATAAVASSSSSGPSSSPSSSQSQDNKSKSAPGPDRSEKQRKAEKIEAAQREKQRKKEMSQIAVQKNKSSNQTMLYAGIAGGVVALVVLMMLYNAMQGSSPAF